MTTRSAEQPLVPTRILDAFIAYDGRHLSLQRTRAQQSIVRRPHCEGTGEHVALPVEPDTDVATEQATEQDCDEFVWM